MLAIVYGSVVYVLFLGTFLYAIAFVGNLVPRSLDGPAMVEPGMALLINVGLLAIFGVQHSLMARRGFKAWWTKVVPKVVERSTYVLFSSAALGALCWHWQPIEGEIWTLREPAAILAVQAVFWLGWGVLLLATFLINHFELFGLRQVFAKLLGGRIPDQEFRTPLLYKHVRHPIYLGFVMAFWAAPVMTVGHLLFAAGATGYILVGIWFEERDLIHQYGDRYRAYKQQVGMLLPRLGGGSRDRKKPV